MGLIGDSYQLTEVQVRQILEMRLHRLTGLEQDKLAEEYQQLLEIIVGLIRILENPDVLLQVIRDELLKIREEYGDVRRTEIRHSEEDLDILDLIAPEDVVVTLSHALLCQASARVRLPCPKAGRAWPCCCDHKRRRLH